MLRSYQYSRVYPAIKKTLSFSRQWQNLSRPSRSLTSTCPLYRGEDWKRAYDKGNDRKTDKYSKRVNPPNLFLKQSPRSGEQREAEERGKEEGFRSIDLPARRDDAPTATKSPPSVSSDYWDDSDSSPTTFLEAFPPQETHAPTEDPSLQDSTPSTPLETASLGWTDDPPSQSPLKNQKDPLGTLLSWDSSSARRNAADLQSSSEPVLSDPFSPSAPSLLEDIRTLLHPPIRTSASAESEAREPWLLWSKKCPDSLRKHYTFSRFEDVPQFMQDVLNYAKVERHHPEIWNSFRVVHVRWTTHKDEKTGLRGLSEKDVKGAKFVDKLWERAVGPEEGVENGRGRGGWRKVRLEEEKRKGEGEMVGLMAQNGENVGKASEGLEGEKMESGMDLYDEERLGEKGEVEESLEEHERMNRKSEEEEYMEEYERGEAQAKYEGSLGEMQADVDATNDPEHVKAWRKDIAEKMDNLSTDPDRFKSSMRDIEENLEKGIRADPAKFRAGVGIWAELEPEHAKARAEEEGRKPEPPPQDQPAPGLLKFKERWTKGRGDRSRRAAWGKAGYDFDQGAEVPLKPWREDFKELPVNVAGGSDMLEALKKHVKEQGKIARGEKLKRTMEKVERLKETGRLRPMGITKKEWNVRKKAMQYQKLLEKQTLQAEKEEAMARSFWSEYDTPATSPLADAQEGFEEEEPEEEPDEEPEEEEPGRELSPEEIEERLKELESRRGEDKQNLKKEPERQLTPEEREERHKELESRRGEDRQNLQRVFRFGRKEEPEQPPEPVDFKAPQYPAVRHIIHDNVEAVPVKRTKNERRRDQREEEFKKHKQPPRNIFSASITARSENRTPPSQEMIRKVAADIDARDQEWKKRFEKKVAQWEEEREEAKEQEGTECFDPDQGRASMFQQPEGSDMAKLDMAKLDMAKLDMAKLDMAKLDMTKLDTRTKGQIRKAQRKRSKEKKLGFRKVDPGDPQHDNGTTPAARAPRRRGDESEDVDREFGYWMNKADKIITRDKGKEKKFIEGEAAPPLFRKVRLDDAAAIATRLATQEQRRKQQEQDDEDDREPDRLIKEAEESAARPKREGTSSEEATEDIDEEKPAEETTKWKAQAPTNFTASRKNEMPPKRTSFFVRRLNAEYSSTKRAMRRLPLEGQDEDETSAGTVAFPSLGPQNRKQRNRRLRQRLAEEAEKAARKADSQPELERADLFLNRESKVANDIAREEEFMNRRLRRGKTPGRRLKGEPIPVDKEDRKQAVEAILGDI